MRVSKIAALVSCLGMSSLAAPSRALPITYGFSARVTSFLSGQSTVEAQAAGERAYLLANPGAATPGWSGSFSFDADTGEFALSLVAPFGDPLHPIQLGGVTVVGFAGDLDALSVPFANGQGSPQYFSRQSDYSDVISWYGTTNLSLGGGDPLVVGGRLRSDLTIADLSVAYLWGEGSPFDAPYLMRGYGCPETETLVQCAYAGYPHYQDYTQTVLLSFAEIHPIPEPSVSGGYLALALFLFATARRFAV